MAVPGQQGPVQCQCPACPVPPIHGAAAPRRRDEGLRCLPRCAVGPGQPGPGVHQDSLQELPHRHALDATGPLPARYSCSCISDTALKLHLHVQLTEVPRALDSTGGSSCMAFCKLLGFRRLISHSCRLNRLLEALLPHPLDLQSFQNQLEWLTQSKLPTGSCWK